MRVEKSMIHNTKLVMELKNSNSNGRNVAIKILHLLILFSLKTLEIELKKELQSLF